MAMNYWELMQAQYNKDRQAQDWNQMAQALGMMQQLQPQTTADYLGIIGGALAGQALGRYLANGGDTADKPNLNWWQRKSNEPTSAMANDYVSNRFPNARTGTVFDPNLASNAAANAMGMSNQPAFKPLTPTTGLFNAGSFGQKYPAMSNYYGWTGR